MNTKNLITAFEQHYTIILIGVNYVMVGYFTNSTWKRYWINWHISYRLYDLSRSNC